MNRFKLIVRNALLLILAFVLTACTGGIPSVIGPQSVAKSDKVRASAPQVPAAEMEALAAGNNAFAFDLYGALRGEGGNLFLSPYSISLALGMTYGGARGETERQMAEALHFTLPQDRLHPAFNALDQQLATRKNAGGEGADGKGFRLNIVNDLWGEQDYTFEQAFLDLLAENYGAGLRLMDFKTNPGGARQEINEYIAEQTEDRIKDLLPADAINSLTRLVLTNAIYFNAAWHHQFEENLTEDAPFTKLDGSEMTVKMMGMYGAESFRYLDGDGFQAIALPYENRDLSMLVILPDEGNFEAFQSGLTAAQFDAILQEMDWADVVLKMPKFTFESQFSLSEQLQALGMVDAFSGDADFSGIEPQRELVIADVIHKSFVAVDENGTEAAAATAVIMEATGALMEVEIIELTVDRPFLFLIHDAPTNTILFLGQALEPAAE